MAVLEMAGIFLQQPWLWALSVWINFSTSQMVKNHRKAHFIEMSLAGCYLLDMQV